MAVCPLPPKKIAFPFGKRNPGPVSATIPPLGNGTQMDTGRVPALPQPVPGTYLSAVNAPYDESSESTVRMLSSASLTQLDSPRPFMGVVSVYPPVAGLNRNVSMSYDDAWGFMRICPLFNKTLSPSA